MSMIVRKTAILKPVFILSTTGLKVQFIKMQNIIFTKKYQSKYS